MAVNFGANTSRYYSVPDHADFTLPTSGWTWLLVVEAVDQTLANASYVLSTGQFNAANTINLWRGSNGTTAQCNVNGGSSATGTAGISANGQRLLYASNIGGTVRGGSINLANLVHAIGGSFTQTAASNGGDVIIGGRSDLDTDRFWSGGVSWVALLNKGLTRDEIMALVQGESLTDAHGSSIVELWDFATADAEIIGQYAGHIATRNGTGYGPDLADPLPYTTAGLVITDPPAPYASGPLRSLVAAMPEQTWAKVNTNNFSSVWTPEGLRPLHGAGNPTPSKIIEAWSGFAWDSNRGDLVIYGGGHANYSGNDVYRWRASTLEWERCSLPSEIEIIPDSSSTFQAIDGAQHAPASAHTYSNNTFLPRLDRFLTFGGAAYNSGSHFVARDGDPLENRRTGPYLFDPSKADPDKVGGTTGSHVQRVEPFPEIVGGEMWDNRDWWANASTLQLVHVNGVTARADEFGKDVIYFGARLGGTTDQHLFRMQINDINDPSQDKVGRVGIYWSGSPQSAGAYDPVRQVFVRTGANSTTPLVYWSLVGSQVDNQSVSVSTASGSMADFRDWYLDYIVGNPDATLNKIGLDYDPVRGNFVMWFGGEAVWRFTPPTPLASTGWVAEQEVTAISPAVPQHKNTIGIYGKWRYAPGYDVFVGLEDISNGEVWVYKPSDWAPDGVPPQGVVTISNVSPGISSADVVYSYDDTDETGFEYRINNGTPASIGASPATITGLTANTDYDSPGLQIRAINADGAGEWSTAVPFSTAAEIDIVNGSPGAMSLSGQTGHVVIESPQIKGIQLTLHQGAQPVGAYSDVQIAFFDQPEPKDFGAPVFTAGNASISAQGVLEVDINQQTALDVGQDGFALVYKLDAGDHRNSLVFAGRVTVVDINE